MKCYVHNEIDAIGTCVNCGKFICKECNTEIKGKNYCKSCVSEVFENLQNQNEKQKAETPMVFMNAGGGGGGSSSSSSSSSSASASGSGRTPHRQSCLLHIVLFIFTAGIGNIIYYLWAKSQ